MPLHTSQYPCTLLHKQAAAELSRSGELCAAVKSGIWFSILPRTRMPTDRQVPMRRSWSTDGLGFQVHQLLLPT